MDDAKSKHGDIGFEREESWHRFCTHGRCILGTAAFSGTLRPTGRLRVRIFVRQALAFVTTIHAVNSSVIRQSRNQHACKIYRGLSGGIGGVRQVDAVKFKPGT